MTRRIVREHIDLTTEDKEWIERRIELNKALAEASTDAKRSGVWQSPVLVAILSGAILALLGYGLDFSKRVQELRIAKRNEKTNVIRNFAQDCDWALAVQADRSSYSKKAKDPKALQSEGIDAKTALAWTADFQKIYFEKPTLIGAIAEARGVFNSQPVVSALDKLYSNAHRLETGELTPGHAMTVDDIFKVYSTAHDDVLKVVEAMQKEVDNDDQEASAWLFRSI